jgi:Lrp/AsnC family leucine-responsive transcriptional regulator
MLDAVDIRLVQLLLQDGRRTNAELAERVALSQSACHRRIKRLEDIGAIAGYAARIDRRAIGLNVMAFVFVKLESHSEELLAAFAQGVRAIDEVVSCHAISGHADYILVVVARDMDAFAAVALEKIVRLPAVKDSSTNFALATLKDETRLPLPDPRARHYS